MTIPYVLCADSGSTFREAKKAHEAIAASKVLALVNYILLILPILVLGIFKGTGTSYYLSNGERIPTKDVYALIEYCVHETDPCSYLLHLR